MSAKFDQTATVIDEEWMIMRSADPQAEEVKIPSRDEPISVSEFIENRIAALESIIEVQSIEIRCLRAQAVPQSTELTLVPPTVASTASLPVFVDSTPIPSSELCSEMSKCFEQVGCKNNAAIVRLNELIHSLLLLTLLVYNSHLKLKFALSIKARI